MKAFKKGLLACAFAAAALGLTGCGKHHATTYDVVEAANSNANAIDNTVVLEGVTTKRYYDADHDLHENYLMTYKTKKNSEIVVSVETEVSGNSRRTIGQTYVVSCKPIQP